ncbi:MAG: hypothetical protein H7346_14320 [Burkholderiaceae bacterium]|nr:hypothetical protein [Burkholderiaceae bacterium]
MTSYETELVIDFGEVGCRQARYPFKVRLKAERLSALFKDAMAAHRVYELLLIERPGDVWDYVSVVVDAAPPNVLQRIEREWSADAAGQRATPPKQVAELPFSAFDQLFCWAGDDTEPEDEVWLRYKDSAVIRAFVKQLLAAADAIRGRLEWADPLIRHTVDRVRSHQHPYTYLSRAVALQRGCEHTPNPASHTDAFYKQLARLLRDPDLTSVAYRADGDHGVLRAMAAEQRRRAHLTGHKPGNAMHLSALTNQRISNEDWGSEIWFFEEGLGHGDLFIECGGLEGAPSQSLFQRHGRVPGRYILSGADKGDVSGFDHEVGDGFVLYRRQVPDPRRVALEMIESRRNSTLGPVMTFEGTGTTLFDYDKAVFVVGESIGAQARSALAEAIAEWQQSGGDPVLLVLGDRKPFEVAGCRRLLQAEVDGVGTTAWFRVALGDAQPWTDVIIALNPPEWSIPVLADLVRDQANPWAPWVVTQGEAGSLLPDHIIDGDLNQMLRQAYKRAQMMRPRQL